MDIADRSERRDAITRRRGQGTVARHVQSGDHLHSSLLMSPFISPLLATFSLVADVLDPEERLYFCSLRLEAAYPMSMPEYQSALILNCTRKAGGSRLGFIGGGHGDALGGLERAVRS
jgi:hypothetical protein